MPTYHYTSPASPYTFGRAWTPGVKALILITAGTFVLQWIFSATVYPQWLSLQIPDVWTSWRVWQVFTYQFLHAGFWHLAFNLFALWMFGCEVEQAIGTRRFIFYYLLGGTGAGCLVAAVGLAAHETSMTMGASGAIFAVLLAYGVLFARRTITLLLFFVLPVQMKARTMVFLFGIVEFLAGIGQMGGQISHVAHLSGLLVGYLYFLVTEPALARQLHFWEAWRLRWTGRKVRRIRTPEISEGDLDRVLEKIAREGMGALTPKERAILAAAARRRQEN